MAEAGNGIYQNAKHEFDYEPVIRTAMRDFGFPTQEAAENAMDAFLQWFSLLPLVEAGKGYVMLNSTVDEIFHSFLLNTAFYRSFCQRTLGGFVDHNPLDQPKPEMPIHDYAVYTVRLLQEQFGSSLNPLLQDWVTQVTQGSYRISCLGECPSSAVAMKHTGMARTPSGAPIIG